MSALSHVPLNQFNLALETTADLIADLQSAQAAGYPYHPSTMYTAMEQELNNRCNPRRYQNAIDPEAIAFNDCDVPSQPGPQPDDQAVADVNRLLNDWSGLYTV